MKDVFNINEFNSLNLEGFKVTTKELYEPENGIDFEELESIFGVVTIDYEEFKEVYNERLLEALSEGENYILEIEGIIEVKGIEFKVMGYKYDYDTKKIELILE